MSRKLVFVFCLFVLLSPLAYLWLNLKVDAKATNEGSVHNIRTGKNYTSIQAAIDAPETVGGDTIIVDAGTYNEHLVVDKSILLTGENNTFIQGSGSGVGIHVIADDVNISGFTVKQYNYGIVLSSDNNMLNGNIVIENIWGVLLFDSGGNVLRNNNMKGNDYNFGVGGRHFSLSDRINDIDTSNKVDSNSIYYVTNQHNFTIDSSTFPEVGYVALINSTDIRVENLTLTHNRHGILLFCVINVTVQNVVVSNNQRGITLSNSSNCTILNSDCVNNGAGIEIFYSKNIVATTNSITNTIANEEGFMLFSSEHCKISKNTVKNTWNSTYLLYSNNSEISENNIINNTYGILLGYSSNNTVTENNVTNNDVAIYFSHVSQNNTISHNDFIHNTKQVYCDNSTNSWDSGYPSGGNYWWDHNGPDLFEGPYQNVTGSDGIGDTAYSIDTSNLDRFPLMAPINIFDAGTWKDTPCKVHVISNSTVSNFQLNKTGKITSFNVTGETGLGFCRVTIPNIIIQNMWQGNYTVLVDEETPLDIRNWTDTTNTYIYFTYQHSEHEVTITPEFPHALILPLFMIATLLAVIVYRRNHSYNCTRIDACKGKLTIYRIITSYIFDYLSHSQSLVYAVY